MKNFTPGLTTLFRSNGLGVGAAGLSQLAPEWLGVDVDVLLGDSLGEMYFYLGLADRVIVGGGFTERGAHNVIEPLAVGKPVLTGPHTWTIEFPFVEAASAGIAESFADIGALYEALEAPSTVSRQTIESFILSHRGASERTLAALDSDLTKSL